MGSDQRKLLGIPPYSYCKPIFNGLAEGNRFKLLTDVPAQLALRLRRRDIHAAFLTPIDYARDSSVYRIAPGVAVSSQLPNRVITLHFNEGIRSVSTLAVNPVSSSEIVLATIILAEEFDVSPAIIPATGSLESLLSRADAALLIGDESIRESSPTHRTIDLVEAWYELTDLPYVHGFWCGRDSDLDAQDIRALQDGAHAAKPVPGPDHPDAVPFDFGAGEESLEGIREFFHYAYFYGVLPDVPDLHFFGDSEPDDMKEEGFLLN